MSQYFELHPTNPQLRLATQAAKIIKEGGIAVYPTDSTYAIGCRITDGAALDRIRQLRKLKTNHLLTIVCKDLAELSVYANVSNAGYRLIRRNTPGPFTFILPATRDVPRKVVGSKRRTIGLRIPDSPIALKLLEALDEPLLSTSMILPTEEHALTDPQAIRCQLEHDVDVILDGGILGDDPSTLVNLEEGVPTITRQGMGELQGL